MGTLLGPDLVDVVVRALPDLDGVRVALHTVREVEAEAWKTMVSLSTYELNSWIRTLVFESDTVIVGVVPLLCGEVVVALPDLHLNTVSGT